MPEMTFLVLNGPNLGFVGQRQPEIYGSRTMEEVPGLVRSLLGEGAEQCSLELAQSNSEGGLIDRLERAHQEGISGIVFNAGALTHTSLALADCLAWIDPPCIEVHLSNLWARPEPLRQQSLIGPHCIGVIAGFGLMSYALAVQALYSYLREAVRVG